MKELGLAEKHGDQLSVKASLIASFISAISEFSIQALGTDIKHFCSNKYCVYTMSSKNIIVMVFSSNLSPTIECIMRELSEEISRLNVDASLIELNSMLKERLEKILDRHITLELSNLEQLKQVYRKILALLKVDNSFLKNYFPILCLCCWLFQAF